MVLEETKMARTDVERFDIARFSTMKRKNLWIAVAACCGVLAAGSLSTNAFAAPKPPVVPAVKLMPALTGWNMDNTQTLNATLPDGLTWIYPDAATKALDTANDGKGSTGFVIWALDDDSGTQPGIQVRTDEPVLDWPLRNCIMASGTRPVTGVKTCGDAQSSSKRFKLRVTSEAPVDLVFDVKNAQPFTYDSLITDNTVINRRIYRVLIKWANFTALRAQGFKVELGTGTGGAFVAVPTANVRWELAPTVTFLSLGSLSTDGDREVWNPAEYATFSPGTYGPLTDRFPIGFFGDTVEGLFPAQLYDTQLIYSGANPSAWALGAVTQNYFSRWGYMLNYDRLPTAIYEDVDGDPGTEGDLVAFWDGANWRYGFTKNFAVVPDSVLGAWGALPLGTTPLPGPRYYVSNIDDLSGLNVDVFITLDETYVPAVDGNTITMRVSTVAQEGDIPGNEATPPWLTPAPPLDTYPAPTDPTTPTETTPTPTVPVVSSGGGGGGCAIGNDGRFDPTLPAMLFAGLGFLGWRRYKAGK
jgi:hypothetical protein